jgi:hypothetical protein
MSDPTWLQATDAIEHVFTAAGILAAGLWTYLHFIKGREHETALQINLNVVSEPYENEKWITFLDVSFVNKGRVKLSATKKQCPAYNDRTNSNQIGQKFDYGMDLQLWQIPGGYKAGEWINWADTLPEITPTGVYKEVDLATGYYKLSKHGLKNIKETDFWIEPGEHYSLGVPFVLGRGCYLAKVTFIGDAGEHEFWQRLFLIYVPSSSKSAESVGET